MVCGACAGSRGGGESSQHKVMPHSDMRRCTQLSPVLMPPRTHGGAVSSYFYRGQVNANLRAISYPQAHPPSSYDRFFAGRHRNTVKTDSAKAPSLLWNYAHHLPLSRSVEALEQQPQGRRDLGEKPG